MAPADVLNIKQAAGGNHFSVDYPIGLGNARVLRPTSEIEAGLTNDPEFVASGEWVQFSTQAGAETTSGSEFPRSELRETTPGSDTNFGFNPRDGGTHWMRTRVKWMTYPSSRPDIIGAQLHSSENDVVQVRTQLISGAVRLALRVYDPGAGETGSTGVPRISESYTQGTAQDLLYMIHGGWLYIFGNDFVQFHHRIPVTDLPITPGVSTYFFKTGCYAQFNETHVTASTRGTTHVQNVHHWHTGWATPENYFGCPEVSLGSAGTVTTSTAFTRTATETGSGITERKWAILDGPAGAGTSIGTSAALSWTPTVVGNYVLAYGAKNAEGWSNPTFLNVTVNPTGGGGGGMGVRSRTTGIGVSASSHSVTLPAGATTGDLVFVGFVNDQADTSTVFTHAGWQNLGELPQGSNVNLTVLSRVLTGSGDSLTVVLTSAQEAAWSVVCMSGNGGTPNIQLSQQGGTPGPTSGTPTAITSLPSSAYDSLIFLALDNNGTTHTVSAPTNYTTNLQQTVNSHVIISASMERFQTGVTGFTPGAVTWTGGGDQYVMAHVVVSAVTATAPTVGAGTDATIDQFGTFSRTATESANGATITSRAWTVQSGPNQVGATLGTAAALSWSPTVGGSYVLRYSATNSVGTGTDDVSVTVNSLNFSVTAPLTLTGTRTGLKNVPGSRTAPLVLTGTRTGLKNVASSPTANLVLSTSVEGHKINVGLAVLWLTGEAINVGRPGEGNPIAVISLLGTATNTSRTTEVDATAELELLGTATAAKNIPNNVGADLTLTASVSSFKNVASSRTADLDLVSSIANAFKNVSSTRTANIVLSGVSSDGEHHTTTVSVTAAVKLLASSVTSSVRFNNNRTALIVLGGFATGERIITAAPRAILPRADNTTHYEVVVVGRVPQVSGPPILFEIDPIDWNRISYTEELNRPSQLSVSCKVSSLTDAIIDRLSHMTELPTELLVYRNGVPTFAGPLVGWRIQGQDGDALSLQSMSLLGYLRYMYVTSDLLFDQVDQFTIASSLVNHWQNQPFGNFGIDTTDISTSGVVRYVTYPRDELHNIGQRIQSLGEGENGFDVEINPSSRRLILNSPRQGVDRSTGEDAIVFDNRNVRSPNVIASVAPGDIASEAFGIGEDGRFSAQSNEDLRVKFGRAGVAVSFYTVEEQATLDAHTRELLTSRDQALVVPGPNARVTPDADLASYNVGDTVAYQVHNRLLVGTGVFRIRKRQVDVSATGQESVSLEFA